MCHRPPLDQLDTASLEIALLRAAGIPARYVYGTIQLPADRAMNWVGGVSKPEAALNLLAQGGIPSIGLVTGGQISHIKMEHVWVEAWIDYIPSRGAVNREGDTWISAVKAIAIAAAQGQKIFTITQENAATALPKIQQRADIMEEIQNALNAGKEVTTSEKPISIPGWTGAGYTIVDPATGAGAYMISGSANGGLKPLIAGIGLGASAAASLVLLGALATLGGTMAIAGAALAAVIVVTIIISVAIYNMRTWLATGQSGCFWLGVGDGATLVGMLFGASQLRQLIASTYSVVPPPFREQVANAVTSLVSAAAGALVSNGIASNTLSECLAP